MNIKLSENIRALRKKNSLTQEQLAEALHVTAGAVYKWEAKLSTPDLQLIVEMADFFDISVDVLLGYELRDNSRKELAERLSSYAHDRSMNDWILEAEKALKKYPNNFDIVHKCSSLYRIKGIEQHNRAYLERALTLLEHSLLLLDQNTDKEISALSIQIDIAVIYANLDNEEHALEILKENNPCHINDSSIGFLLASSCDKPSDSIPYLSMALLDTMGSLIRITLGYVNVYIKQKEYQTTIELLLWYLNLSQGLKKNGSTSFLEKEEALLRVVLARTYLYNDSPDSAKDSLYQALSTAQSFDASPTYQGDSIRYVTVTEKTSVVDDLGETAVDGIQKYIDEENDSEFTKLWETIKYESKTNSK